MKKIIYCLLATCLSLTLFPFQSIASSTEKPSSLAVTKPPEPVESAELKAMLKRVDGLNTADKTTLSTHKKTSKQIVVETREHRHGGYGYISIGAVILIVLLVVILL